VADLIADAHVARALRHVGATAQRLLRQTDKATVVDARWRGQRVVVKVLTTADPYWRELWVREGRVFANFAKIRAPFSCPAVLYDEDGVRILTFVAGEALHGARIPAQPLDEASVTAAVEALRSVTGWSTDSLPTVDYRHLLGRTGESFDKDMVRAALERVDTAPVAQHGDPLPSNLLITADGVCVLVDFEHSGLFLPGYDMAVLTCVLAGQPATVRRIVADAAATVDRRCFAVNLSLVAEREARLHWACEPAAERHRRLRLIDDVATLARAELAAYL
jgi:aminoglycoside phosphotransferase (APT) family kinase protein